MSPLRPGPQARRETARSDRRRPRLTIRGSRQVRWRLRPDYLHPPAPPSRDAHLERSRVVAIGAIIGWRRAHGKARRRSSPAQDLQEYRNDDADRDETRRDRYEGPSDTA